MRSLGKLMLFISLVFVLVGFTESQQPGGFGGKGKGGGNDYFSLVANPQVKGELKITDERLAQSNWLVDAEISAADIAIFPAVQLLLRAAGKEAARPLELGLIPLSKTFPNIARWINRIEELPNYQRTYPPHWRE